MDLKAIGVFMHPNFAHKCQAIIQLKQVLWKVQVIDRRLINFGIITHKATVELDVVGHQELLVANLINMERYLFVLETPWLFKHDPSI